jgi:hypothetical protein
MNVNVVEQINLCAQQCSSLLRPLRWCSSSICLGLGEFYAVVLQSYPCVEPRRIKHHLSQQDRLQKFEDPEQNENWGLIISHES